MTIDELQKEMTTAFTAFRVATDKYVMAMDGATMTREMRRHAMVAAIALEQGSIIQIGMAQAIRAREERLAAADEMN